jgi:peptidoglycan/LPS O-acetylase OafA/YrhL
VKHRTDIDGLRAIAVAAVLVYHIAPHRLPGGVIAVDMFFVISGFLISAMLVRELETGRFSLASFYVRRIRRIVPALFVALAFVTLAAYQLLLPSELAEFGRRLLSSASFTANMYFQSQSGYFAPDAQANVLLHIWTLAVEVQFYLLYPVLVVGLFALPRQKPPLPVAILALLLASLAISQALAHLDPPAAYYGLPSRFWQFMVGAIAALLPHAPRHTRLHTELGAALGLAMLAASLALFSPALPLPGLLALLPAAGTAFVLYWGRHDTNSLTAQLLSIWPAKWLGRISYSVYLWHWPLIVFYKLRINATPAGPEQIGLLLVAVALGTLSYFTVERVFLRQPPGQNPSRVFGATLTCSLLLCASALMLAQSDGFASRFPGTVANYARYLDYDPRPPLRAGQCFLDSASQSADEFDTDLCVQLSSTRPNILLLGDSHAAQLYPGVQHQFPRVHFSQITASGCKPLLHTTGPPRCTDLMDRAFTQILPHHPFDAIVIAARWNIGDHADLVATLQALEPAMLERVIVLGPVVTYTLPLPRLLATASMGGANASADQSRKLVEARAIDAALRTATASSGVRYHSALDALCPNDRCAMLTADDVPVQFDSNHLTAAGSNLLVERLAQLGLHFGAP